MKISVKDVSITFVQLSTDKKAFLNAGSIASKRAAAIIQHNGRHTIFITKYNNNNKNVFLSHYVNAKKENLLWSVLCTIALANGNVCRNFDSPCEQLSTINMHNSTNPKANTLPRGRAEWVSIWQSLNIFRLYLFQHIKMPTAYTKLQQITNSFNGIYYSQPHTVYIAYLSCYFRSFPKRRRQQLWANFPREQPNQRI